MRGHPTGGSSLTYGSHIHDLGNLIPTIVAADMATDGPTVGGSGV
jgi:hypothetical protein